MDMLDALNSKSRDQRKLMWEHSCIRTIGKMVGTRLMARSYASLVVVKKNKVEEAIEYTLSTQYKEATENEVEVLRKIISYGSGTHMGWTWDFPLEEVRIFQMETGEFDELMETRNLLVRVLFSVREGNDSKRKLTLINLPEEYLDSIGDTV